ncbi:MAG TPA: hypothetical protein PK941_12730 [Paludibacter sp.]|nr:hypothetical protein [Paludibacter sp.]
MRKQKSLATLLALLLVATSVPLSVFADTIINSTFPPANCSLNLEKSI